ncbi:MAG: GNAT family N-acetyltransferase [Anaerorhabdus sp.]
MIRQATKREKEQIKKMWVEHFTYDKIKYVEYYFNERFDEKNTLIYEENGVVLSSIQHLPYEMMFNNRILKTSLISGIGTFLTYESEILIDAILNTCEHQELITLASAENPELFLIYGFEEIYLQNEIRIKREDLKNIGNHGCSYEASSVDMVKLYASFVKHFSGYTIRDVKYFDNLKKEVEAKNGKIISYYNNGLIEGYGILLPKSGSEVYLEECIYLNSKALTKLVNLALQHRSNCILKTSSAEDLSAFFPRCEIISKNYMLARINDFDLFNRLYRSSATTTKEAYAIAGKGLFIRESI